MIVYLDLDRTLFRTELSGAMWQYIGDQHPEATGAFEQQEKFYRYVDELYYYDMSAHLESIGLEAGGIYDELRAAGFADGQFEFEGTKELIESLQELGHDVRLLSFGSEQYQTFKASLCPSLIGLPLVVTQRPKHEVLEDFVEECWLVDDRAIGDELPGNVSFIQICHDPEMVPTSYVDWTVKRSLGEVQAFFKAIAEDD